MRDYINPAERAIEQLKNLTQNISPAIAENKISLCMIVKNEERNILDCLESFKGIADEIIVVDTGSDDDTVKIVTDFKESNSVPVEIFHHSWDDNFSHARNYSMDKAKHPWILWADADDRFDSDVHSFNNYKKKLDLSKAYMLNIVNTADGRIMMEFLQSRLFPRRNDIRFHGGVHESVNCDLDKNNIPIVAIPQVKINHTGYGVDKSLMDVKQKRNKKILDKEKYKRADSWFFLGHYYTHFDNPYFALSCYMQVVIDSNCTAAITEKSKFFIGYQFEKLRLFPTAIEWYEASDDSDAIYRKGLCYLAAENIIEAKKCFEEYIHIGPHYSPVGNLYHSQREKALKELQRITANEFKHWQGFEL